MVKTMMKAPVLLPKPVVGRLGERSACVTAILFGILESTIIHAGSGSGREIRSLSFGMYERGMDGIVWSKGCFKSSRFLGS